MDVTSLIVFLAIGAVAGWLAGLLVKGYGFGLIGNIVVGIIGAFVGGFLANVFGLAASGLLGAVGLGFGALYFFTFSFAIRAFNLKSPGREDDDSQAC